MLPHQLLNQLFPSQAVSQLSSNYHSIHEAIFLSSPEELAAMNGVGSQSIRKILAFRELSYRIDTERSTKVKNFHHPSVDYNPSKEDLLVTEALVASGKLLEIPVLDHLIITHSGYFSFLEKGVLATS